MKTSLKNPPSSSTGSANGNGSSRRRGSEAEVSGAQAEVNPAAAALNGKLRAETIQADRDAFLSAFEKPTQIYRYIRSRMIHSPIFLHRNLSYMKQRMSRTHKSRSVAKVDDILGLVMAKLNSTESDKNGKDTAKNFYNIILLGLTDPDHNWAPDTKAKVEIQIARICLKKRKELRAPIMKAFEGVCEVRVQSVKCTNPSSTTSSPSSTGSSPLAPNTTSPTNNNKPQYQNQHVTPNPPSPFCPVISVPADCFNLVNGHVVRSYVLIVKVTIPKSALVKAGVTNGVGSTPHLPKALVSPPQVCKKSAQKPVTGNGPLFVVNPSSLKASGLANLNTDLYPKVIIKKEDLVIQEPLGAMDREGEEPKPKRRRSAPARDREQFVYSGIGASSGGADDQMVFMGQITIYDKQLSIGLGSADYELILRQSQKRRASFSLSRFVKQEASWEILDSSHPKVQIFPNGSTGKAKLNVAIRTSAVKVGPLIERPISVLSSSCTTKNGCHGGDSGSGSAEGDADKSGPLKVIYQFLYNNNSRQQTEAREDLRCPWCSLNCLSLYSLLKHLKLCHPRFHFAYVPVPNGARIDVSLNEAFDGSYSGSAYDLVAQPPGEAFARNGPTKRTNIFSILVCRPPKLLPSLHEFLENEEKDAEQRKTFITGHNRLYHHTTTCLPIQPKEIDVDSEGEPDPEWLQTKTAMMIDDFTDVNEGEKELMKMWNLHVLKHNYVGDCQIPLACDKFVEYQGKELIRKNLYRNFILHLTNLFDFGLLNPIAFYKTVQSLHVQMKENDTAGSLRDFWKAHMVQSPSLYPKADPAPLEELGDLTITAKSVKDGDTKLPKA